MKLYNLPKIKDKSKKRSGRGLGSGLGKTAGRGSKGQKSRGKIPVGFSGSRNAATFRKLPLRKGLGNPKISSKPSIVNLSDLASLKAKTTVDIDELVKEKLITQKDAKKGVKILGNGEINVALTIKLPVSQKAQEKIEKKGGKVEYV